MTRPADLVRPAFGATRPNELWVADLTYVTTWSRGWKNVGSTTTSSTGTYKKSLKDKKGKYRAQAKKITLNTGADICKKAKSPVRKHSH